MGHYTKSDGSCWLQRYAATSDEALHNYPATHFGRNPPASTIQFRHWKRRGVEPVPDPRGSKIPHCRKLRLSMPVAAEGEVFFVDFSSYRTFQAVRFHLSEKPVALAI